MSWVRQTDDRSFEIAKMILSSILPIIIIIIGAIGNILCIHYLLQRKQRRSRSTCIYLIFIFLAIIGIGRKFNQTAITFEGRAVFRNSFRLFTISIYSIE
jgi:hypothetical protein